MLRLTTYIYDMHSSVVHDMILLEELQKKRLKQFENSLLVLESVKSSSKVRFLRVWSHYRQGLFKD
jgi:hypothetical protein